MTRVLTTLTSSLVALIVVNTIMPFILPKLKKREIEDNKRAVNKKEVRMDKAITRFYKFACVFITLCAVVFMIPQVCEVMEASYITVLIICFVGLTLVYLSSWLMLKRVDYTDEYCEYTNPMGFKKRFAYSDIVKVKYTGGIIRITSNNKKSFTVFKAYAGSNDFVLFVKEKNPQVQIIVKAASDN